MRVYLIWFSRFFSIHKMNTIWLRFYLEKSYWKFFKRYRCSNGMACAKNILYSKSTPLWFHQTMVHILSLPQPSLTKSFALHIPIIHHEKSIVESIKIRRRVLIFSTKSAWHPLILQSIHIHFMLQNTIPFRLFSLFFGNAFEILRVRRTTWHLMKLH